MRDEPGVTSADGPECPAVSPGGWACCLPLGHDGNHVGTTQDYGKLYQWAPAPVVEEIP